jgi:hypothetical protein
MYAKLLLPDGTTRHHLLPDCGLQPGWTLTLDNTHSYKVGEIEVHAGNRTAADPDLSVTLEFVDDEDDADIAAMNLMLKRAYTMAASRASLSAVRDHVRVRSIEARKADALQDAALAGELRALMYATGHDPHNPPSYALVDDEDEFDEGTLDALFGAEEE